MGEGGKDVYRDAQMYGMFLNCLLSLSLSLSLSPALSSSLHFCVENIKRLIALAV